MTATTEDLTGLWARRIIDEAQADGTPLNRYGSLAWHLEARSCPARALASLLVFGEAWRRHTSSEQVAADLRDEMQREDDAVRRRFKDASLDVAATIGWPCYPSQSMPTRAEMQRRRGEAA